MVTIEKQSDKFIFKIKGLHKLWALKSQITIPKDNIIKAYPNKEKLNWIMGLRMPGTNIPGVITAGTYIVKDGKIFCDVSNYKKSIVVELKDEFYKKLVIEVDNVENALSILDGD